MAHRADAEEVGRALRLLHEPGAVFEVRIPRTARHGTVSGYFNDVETAAGAVVPLSGRVPGIYVTLNPVNPALLARSANRLKSRAGTTTADNDITCRRWLPIDLDPERPAGISSTDPEHDAALVRAQEARDWLAAQGWPAPIRADSGNGAHLLYRVDLPNDDADRRLVESCLKALALRFDDGAVKVDTGTTNAARIWKAHGTLACKGDDLPDRPHRLARILEAPEPLAVVPRERLEALAATLPPEPPRSTGNASPRDGHGAPFDVDAWLQEHQHEEPLRVGAWGNGGRRWVYQTCPWDPEHTDRAFFVVQFPSGAMAAGCHHNGCEGRAWPDYRALREPGYRAHVPPVCTGTHGGAHTGSPAMSSEPGSSQPVRCVPPYRGDRGVHTAWDRLTVAALSAAYEPTTWCVADLLPTAGTLLMAGALGVGKTWLTLLMALAVATGRRFLDRFQAAQGAVLLVLEEEHRSAVLERVDLLCAGLGLAPEQADALPLHFLIGQGVNLVSGHAEPAEWALHPELVQHIQEVNPALVVLDPFRRLHGRDENDSAEMSGLFSLLRRLTAAHGCSLLLVHHLRKRSEGPEEALDRLRGSSDIAASADSVVEVGGQFGHLVVSHSKSKRGRSLPRFVVSTEQDGGALRFRFLDPDAQAETDRLEARTAVLHALEEGPRNRAQLQKVCAGRGVGRKRLEKMLEELKTAGRLTATPGPNRSTIYQCVPPTRGGGLPTICQGLKRRQVPAGAAGSGRRGYGS
ncbi:MAG: AAA family ATPase [Candidatus Latescibacterota bacterium]